MKEVKIFLGSIERVKNFVNEVSHLECDIDIVSGRYVIDAKSMLGVFSLPRFDQIEINVDETDFEHMKQKLQKYGLIQK